MKSPLFTLLLFSMFNPAIAQLMEPQEELAEIYSIDEDRSLPNYVEASNEALPSNFYQELIRQTGLDRLTPISSSRANSLFAILKSDRQARMKYPNGFCTRRRIYIQSVLRNKNIVSGKLYIRCPGNNGRLRFRDQASRRYFTFSNFHDTNVVLVNTGSSNSYRVMDLQFQSSPVSLGAYLAQIEAHQRIKPGKSADDAGICYWKISWPSFTDKEYNGMQIY